MIIFKTKKLTQKDIKKTRKLMRKFIEKKKLSTDIIFIDLVNKCFKTVTLDNNGQIDYPDRMWH